MPPRQEALKSDTLDLVHMGVCIRYKVLILENCSNRREKGKLLLWGGFAAQMEPRSVRSVCLSSPHVFVRSLHKDTLRKKKEKDVCVRVSGDIKCPL